MVSKWGSFPGGNIFFYREKMSEPLIEADEADEADYLSGTLWIRNK